MSSRYDIACSSSTIRAHFYRMIEVAKGKDVVEIGFKDGNSACAFMQSCRSLSSVDIRECDTREFSGDQRFRFVHGDSTKIEPIPCDVLFIDGDHSFQGAQNDLFKWAPFARERILLHDTMLKAKSMVVREVHAAVMGWLAMTHDVWTVDRHDRSEYGLMELVRL